MAFREKGGASAAMTKLSGFFMKRRNAQRCAPHLTPHVQSHFRILDIGCGPGSITIDLAKLVPDGHVVGLDINSDTLEVGRTAAQELNVKNVEFIQHDIQDLSKFESESFDIVHAHQTLLHLTEPVSVMREMRRLTKTGGIVSTRDMARYALVTPEPKLVEHFDKILQYSQSKGSNPYFGAENHEAARAAGFGWSDIEMSSLGSEESGEPAREVFAQGVRDSMRDIFIGAGLATSEQMDEYGQLWDEWGQNPASRLMILDSALLCWKRD